MAFLSMSWQGAAFLHWPVDPAAVDRLVPGPLSVETYDGSAWVGAVPFRMVGLHSWGSPSTTTFAEVNFRTYVRYRDRPGTYFFSLDADDSLVVALSRRLGGLPYYRAETRLRNRDGRIRFASRRTHPDAGPARFVATVTPDDGAEANHPASGSFEEFLVGRKRYYTLRDGSLHVGHVEREPFRLRPGRARVADNTLFAAAGLSHPDADPEVLVAAGGVDVTAGRVRPVTE